MTSISTFLTFPAFALSHILMFCEYPDANSMSIGNDHLKGCSLAYFPFTSHILIAFQRIRAGMEELEWIIDDLADIEQQGEAASTAFAAWRPDGSRGRAFWVGYNVRGCRIRKPGEEVG